MAFNSLTFVLFCLVVFPLYYFSTLRLQNLLLLIASYVFYGAWDWRFLSLIVLSTLIDFVVGKKLHHSQDDKVRRKYLLLSCIFNLGMLGVFKYFNFFISSAESLIGTLTELPTENLRLNIVLPVGISFYTFQTMSYTIDIYRRKLEPTTDLLNFALFVAYFPQLVAGPIERASHLLPQICSPRTITWTHVREGIWLIILGLFKKIVIADNLAIIANQAFGAEETPNGLICLLAIYAFAYQIYCDFSGYSDIARGLARLMGIDIMKNFNIPYLSTNPSEFWRRWHISLSTWLRDYLYISLGGNRGTVNKTYRNLMLTMILGGLWHGAAWTFIFWGIYQGLLLVIHRLTCIDRQIFQLNHKVLKALWMIVWFHFVCFGWLIFRAESMEQVYEFTIHIFTDFLPHRGVGEYIAYLVLFVPMLWLVELFMKNADDPREGIGWKYGVGYVVICLMLLAMVLFPAPVQQTFIYFQF